MSENGEIYTAGKNFTLPPALAALTNFNSALPPCVIIGHLLDDPPPPQLMMSFMNSP